MRQPLQDLDATNPTSRWLCNFRFEEGREPCLWQSVGPLTSKASKRMPISFSPAVFVAGFSFLVPAASIASPACDSIETRKALLDFVLSDGSNRLADFAAKNNSVNGSSRNETVAKSKRPESHRPFYELGQKFVTTGKTKDRLTVRCSGALSASVGDTKATKEIDFTVQQTKDGALSVSVEPFQF
jgi:hypothetical protein